MSDLKLNQITATPTPLTTGGALKTKSQQVPPPPERDWNTLVLDEVVDATSSSESRTESADPSTTVSNNLDNRTGVNVRTPQLTVAVQVPQNTSPQAIALQRLINAVVTENRPFCCSNGAFIALGMSSWLMAIPQATILAQIHAPNEAYATLAIPMVLGLLLLSVPALRVLLAQGPTPG